MSDYAKTTRQALTVWRRHRRNGTMPPKRTMERLVSAARRLVRLTETGPDYEAVRQKIKWLVECAVHGDNIDAVVSEILVAVDAVLADYLTEEE